MAMEYCEGPDQVKPAEDLTTTLINGSVRLRIPESGLAIETCKPISVPGLMKRTVDEFPNHVALGYKEDDIWKTITYKEYLELVRTAAKAFLHLGLERYHAVCILGFNSPEWFISDLAAIFAGGIAAGIYTTNSSEACYYCADSSKANIIVVQDGKQLEKILAVRSRLPHLKAIIQYEGEPSSPDVLSWKRLMEIGIDQSDELLDNVLKTIAVNECCTLVYTSGTVGNPKAVMLSHDNLTWDATVILERISATKGSETIVSFLPLSHVAAQVADIYLTLSAAGSVYFADKNAFKGTLVETLKEVQPTCFLAVPRVWEKMYEKMMSVGRQSGRLTKTIANWAKNQALNYHLNRMNGIESPTWGYTIASNLIFKRIKQAIGLNRCKLYTSAAAPLSSEIKKYFLSIDIPILEVFGMSESSGAHIMCPDNNFTLDTVGITLNGMKTKIFNPDNDGQGEICLNGRNIFMGYLNDIDKTNETIDPDGWLHTGDLGRIDNKNFIYITGRLKELLITAGGENIPPIPIEELIKNELPNIISNAFLVGDQKKFLSVLLTFKTDIDPDTNEPLDTLLPNVQQWLNELGCPAKTVSEIIAAGPDSKLLNALNDALAKANTHAISNAQKVQKFAILPADFSIPTGELGPTLKVKRNVVAKKYADIIESLYV